METLHGFCRNWLRTYGRPPEQIRRNTSTRMNDNTSTAKANANLQYSKTARQASRMHTHTHTHKLFSRSGHIINRCGGRRQRFPEEAKQRGKAKLTKRRKAHQTQSERASTTNTTKTLKRSRSTNQITKDRQAPELICLKIKSFRKSVENVQKLQKFRTVSEKLQTIQKVIEKLQIYRKVSES